MRIMKECEDSLMRDLMTSQAHSVAIRMNVEVVSEIHKDFLLPGVKYIQLAKEESGLMYPLTQDKTQVKKELQSQR